MTLPRAYLLQHIKDMSGLAKPNTSIYYEHDPNYTASAPDQCLIKLRYRTLQANGVENTRYNLTGSTFTTDIVGWRTAVLTLTCETYSKGSEPADILDGILMRMCRDSASQDRVTNNVGWQTTGPIIDLPTRQDNRIVAKSTVDLFFSVVALDEQTQTNQGWIDKVNTDNKIPGDFQP